MNKMIRSLSILIYFFTAQLSVHAFTMHWSLHWESHWGAEHHESGEECSCWDKKSTHDHDMPNWEDDDHYLENKDNDHEKHNMTMCLEQSLWVFVLDSVDIVDYEYGYILPSLDCTTIQQDRIDQYFYSINDPWRWDDWCFSEFLNNDLYGHWIIMHC